MSTLEKSWESKFQVVPFPDPVDHIRQWQAFPVLHTMKLIQVITKNINTIDFQRVCTQSLWRSPLSYNLLGFAINLNSLVSLYF